MPDGLFSVGEYGLVSQYSKFHANSAGRNVIPGFAFGQGGGRAADQHRGNGRTGMQGDIGAPTTKANGLARRGAGTFGEQDQRVACSQAGFCLFKHRLGIIVGDVAGGLDRAASEDIAR